MAFIQSEFRGQLPAHYPHHDPGGTSRIPEDMNDWNREEESRYVNLTTCDYLVDLIDPTRVTAREPNYAERAGDWRILAEQEFLNAAQSHQFFRAFYIPWLSSQYTTYNSYAILKRVGGRPKKVAGAGGGGGGKQKNKMRGKEFYEDDI